MKTVISFIFFLYLSVNALQSQDHTVIGVTTGELRSIDSEAYILRDDAGKLTIKDMSEPECQRRFKKIGQSYVSIPPSQFTYWIRFTIQNLSHEDLLLRAGNGRMAYVDFYRPSTEGREYDSVSTGLLRPFSQREYATNQLWFSVSKRDQSQPRTFFLKVNSCGNILELPLYVGSYFALHKDQQKLDWLVALYAGAIIVMILYNLFIFFSVRDITYLFYILYLIVLSTGLIYTRGSYIYYWLYRSHEKVNFYFFAHNNFTLLLATLFVHHFLKVRARESYLLLGLYGLSLICVSLGVINLVVGQLGHYNWWLGIFTNISLYTFIGFYFLFLWFVVVCYCKKGVKQARFVLFGWVVFIPSIWVRILAIRFNLLPINLFTREAILFGNAIEVVLFSLALADRINALKKERELAQLKALEQAKENERIVKYQNEILEQKISERAAELRVANQVLKEQNQKLKDLDEEKDSLIGVIAHDLRSPLNSIRGLTGLTRTDTNSGERYLTMIDKIAEDGNQLIEDLMVLSRANSTKKSENHISEIEPARFIEDVLIPFREQAAKKNISFVWSLGRLPATFIVDDISLRRVIENLVSNAIKFTPPAKNVRVKIKWFPLSKELTISVKDEGPGITETDKKRMFRRFQRLSARPTAGENSTGLGLAIVKSLVEKLSGRIEVNSMVGEGSEFLVRLPI